MYRSLGFPPYNFDLSLFRIILLLWILILLWLFPQKWTPCQKFETGFFGSFFIAPDADTISVWIFWIHIYPRWKLFWTMNEKTLIIIIGSLLAIGFVSLLFIIVPWFSGHGFSNWKQTLMDDGLIIVAIIFFVFGFYMNTKMHWKKRWPFKHPAGWATPAGIGLKL